MWPFGHWLGGLSSYPRWLWPLVVVITMLGRADVLAGNVGLLVALMGGRPRTRTLTVYGLAMRSD